MKASVSRHHTTQCFVHQPERSVWSGKRSGPRERRRSRPEVALAFGTQMSTHPVDGTRETELFVDIFEIVGAAVVPTRTTLVLSRQLGCVFARTSQPDERVDSERFCSSP